MLNRFRTFLCEPATTLSPKETAWCAVAAVPVVMLAGAGVYAFACVLCEILP